MKNTILLFSVMLLLSVSCKKEEPGNFSPAETKKNVLTNLPALKEDSGGSYNDSREKWKLMKQDNGESYVYQTQFTSMAGSEITEIKVEKGKVTERKYVSFRINEAGKLYPYESYEENQKNLGTHELGAPIMTIDELYESCLKDYLVADPAKNQILFYTTDHGLLTTCGFFPKGCADDCFQGFRITAFNWIRSY